MKNFSKVLTRLLILKDFKMNKQELKALAKVNANENVENLLSVVNGETNVSEGDVVSFAPNYKAGENVLVQSTNTGNKYLTFAVTIGEQHDENNVTLVSSGMFARRFAFTDINTNEKISPTIDGVPFKGSNQTLLDTYKGKKLKWESTKTIETSFGETKVRNWVTVE